VGIDWTTAVKKNKEEYINQSMLYPTIAYSAWIIHSVTHFTQIIKKGFKRDSSTRSTGSPFIHVFDHLKIESLNMIWAATSSSTESFDVSKSVHYSTK
jgi:hypothetical protein